MGAYRAEQQRVTIGGCIDHAGDADNAASARDVLDHNGLAEKLSHSGRNDAAEHIKSAPCGEGHHHCDGARWIALRMSCNWPSRRYSTNKTNELPPSHVWLPDRRRPSCQPKRELWRRGQSLAT